MEPKDIEQIAEVINQAVEPLHDDNSEIKADISEIKADINKMKAEMVTKSYLDDKLGDLSGDLVVKLRKEDAKVDRLAEILRRKEVINDSDLKQLSEYQIFPKFNLEER